MESWRGGPSGSRHSQRFPSPIKKTGPPSEMKKLSTPPEVVIWRAGPSPSDHCHRSPALMKVTFRAAFGVEVIPAIVSSRQGTGVGSSVGVAVGARVGGGGEVGRGRV